MTSSLTPLLALTVCLSACSSSGRTDPLMKEAASYHQQATKIQEAIEPTIEQIDSLKQVVQDQGLPGASARAATLDSLRRAFDEWEENLVEVPGMPHEHHHGKGAHHHHPDATLKDLPADQMRDLQREMLQTIRRIEARLTAVMN